MSNEEKKPILKDSAGVYGKQTESNATVLSLPIDTNGQQHLIIQPIEFDTRHRNYYGYLSFAAFILVLINYIMIKERPCQFTFANATGNYDLVQSLHLAAMMVAIIVFILSYFNFAMVIHEFKILFYSSAAFILVSAGLLIYAAVLIFTAPCVGETFQTGLIQVFGVLSGQGTNVFKSKDGIGITVFFFDLISSGLLLAACRSFYKR